MGQHVILGKINARRKTQRRAQACRGVGYRHAAGNHALNNRCQRIDNGRSSRSRQGYCIGQACINICTAKTNNRAGQFCGKAEVTGLVSRGFRLARVPYAVTIDVNKNGCAGNITVGEAAARHGHDIERHSIGVTQVTVRRANRQAGRSGKARRRSIGQDRKGCCDLGR